MIDLDVLTGLKPLDDDDKELALLPEWADRMTYHTKRLRVIQYVEGLEGVKRYKQKHPEARSIQVKAATTAFQPKPAGYDDFICAMVRRWFVSDAALAETNRAAVNRLNIAMAPRWFNPDNHFSTLLSPGRLTLLAALFAEHGHHLDTSVTNTMTKVRSAVKAAKGRGCVGLPFGKVGHITGDQLVIGCESLRVEQHSGHACIRVIVNGARVRLRLDALAEFIGLAGLVSGDGVGGDVLPYLTIVDIRELAPIAENPDFDPLAGIAEFGSPIELAPDPDTTCSSPRELAPIAEPLSLCGSLSERIIALKAAQQPHSTACPDADPLTLP